jgi:hypothetical protein
MRRYIQHIKETREPHERRAHAMRVAGLLTGAIFAVWLGTLGYRLSTGSELAESPDTSLTAAAAAAAPNTEAHLQVSTTSILNY